MPEEHNRVLTDHCSASYFAQSYCNGQFTGRKIKQNVHFVGDTMGDAVLAFTPHALHKSKIVNELNLKQKNLFSPQFTDRILQTSVSFERLLKALSKLEFKVIFPIHPRLESRLLQFSLMLPQTLAYLLWLL